MDIDIAKEIIRKLNNPQLGSFGEYLVAEYGTKVLKKSVIGVHRDGIDLIIDGNRVDVGSQRKLDKRYSRGKITNKDVFVFFCKDACIIHYPSRFEANLSWEDVSLLFEEWQKNHKPGISNDTDVSYKAEYGELKQLVSSFFKEHGYKARIIYRTVSRQFGLGESPDNLLPKVTRKEAVSVYVDFNDFRRVPENIRFIVAFPDEYANELPRQEKVVLKSGKKNVVKVDLHEIIETISRCYFENLDQLMNDFFIRYPLPQSSSLRERSMRYVTPQLWMTKLIIKAIIPATKNTPNPRKYPKAKKGVAHPTPKKIKTSIRPSG